MNRLHRWLVAACCAAVGFGCISTDLVGDNCQVNGMPCPPPSGGPPDGGGPEGFDKLDLLFVVENTSSMADVQRRLAQWLPDLMRAMRTGDLGFDGRADFDPIAGGIRLAVVSSDLGTPGLAGISGCDERGDDGQFLNAASGEIVLGAQCVASPSFLEFDATTSLPNTFDQQAGCRAFVGTDGCSYPMPLEAALKALSSDATLTFAGGGVAHGIDTQPGFVRSDALLGIIVVTNDDDCSMSALTPVDPALRFDYRRCPGPADHVHKLSRYMNGFGGLKGGPLRALFLGVIAGVPTDLAASVAAATVPADRAQRYIELLEDDRMLKVPDEALPPGASDVRKSCGQAYPPTRLVELASRLETGHSAVGSICDGDLEVPMRVMATGLARLIDPSAAL